MTYRIAEGSLALADEWRDQSVNVLLPQAAPAGGANLVIARDRLPIGMTFPQYLDQQRQNFGTHFAKLETILDTPGTVGDHEAHFFELTWQNEGKPIHQVMALARNGEHDLLHFTGTISGGSDLATRDMLINAILSFTFA